MKRDTLVETFNDTTQMFLDNKTVGRISTNKYHRHFIPQIFLYGTSVYVDSEYVTGVSIADLDNGFVQLRDGRRIEGEIKYSVEAPF